MDQFRGRGRITAPLAAFALGCAAVTAAHALCPGDCDDDGRVGVAELVLGVNIALGTVQLAACPQYACVPDDCIHIDLILRGVESAIYGCPATPLPATPMPTPTPIPPTVTRTPNPDPVIAALDVVIETTCTLISPFPFRPFARATEQGYALDCDAPIGHDSDADLVRYPSATDAALAFADASRQGTPAEFRDLPAAYWEVPFEPGFFDGAHRYLVWQLGCWVITAHSFDDTSYRLAAQPVPFSEAILDAAGDLLLARCGAS
jgi:hypothetical protein